MSLKNSFPTFEDAFGEIRRISADQKTPPIVREKLREIAVSLNLAEALLTQNISFSAPLLKANIDVDIMPEISSMSEWFLINLANKSEAENLFLTLEAIRSHLKIASEHEKKKTVVVHY